MDTPQENGVVIAVGNQKGGVGKTTNTVHIAAALGLFGFRCLIVDLDPAAGATKHLGVQENAFAGALEVLTGYDTVAPLAIAQYKMSLHDLYRVALLSAANQKRLRSDEQLKQMIKETEAAGRTNDAAEMTQVLNGGFKLPATKYP